jgi:hypothetical protein
MIKQLLTTFLILFPSGLLFVDAADHFPVGRLVESPKTARLSPMELYEKTIGKPGVDAVLKAKGDPEKYIALRGLSGMAGKAFEAETAIKVNQFLTASKKTERILVTAAEGKTADASDLVLLKDNRVVKKYQLKLNGKTTQTAIFDPKYADLILVCPEDELNKLKEELRKEKLKASAKNKPLPPSWIKTENEINSGRLTDTITGCTVPTREEAEKAARNYAEKAVRDVAALFQTAQ